MRGFGKTSASVGAAVALMLIASLLLAVEGTWSLGLFRHWTFVTITVLTLVMLGIEAFSDFKRRSFVALMSHLGLFLVLSGGILGAPARTELQMRLYSDESQGNMTVDAAGNPVQLPFNVSLISFGIDFYEDGASPKQYSSVLNVDGKEMTVGVNHPCRYRGYRMYQSGFDSRNGRYSVLKVVRDPCLPVVAFGALLLAVAAILGLGSSRGGRKCLPAVLALAVLFAVLTVMRIRFGTLMPALRSFWFIPHISIYMLAYSAMALSAVTGVVSLFCDKVPEKLAGRLLSAGASLLLTGMICGAVWAQQAWGDYWTWDAKECWAAATWLLALAGTHIRGKRKLVFIILAFLAIQMTWYGVNRLPAAGNSLHTYNQSAFTRKTKLLTDPFLCSSACTDYL